MYITLSVYATDGKRNDKCAKILKYLIRIMDLTHGRRFNLFFSLFMISSKLKTTMIHMHVFPERNTPIVTAGKRFNRSPCHFSIVGPAQFSDISIFKLD